MQNRPQSRSFARGWVSRWSVCDRDCRGSGRNRKSRRSERTAEGERTEGATERGGSSTSGPGIVAGPVSATREGWPAFGAVAARYSRRMPRSRSACLRQTRARSCRTKRCRSRRAPAAGCGEPLGGSASPPRARSALTVRDRMQTARWPGPSRGRLPAIGPRAATGGRGQATPWCPGRPRRTRRASDAARAEVTSPVGEGSGIVFHCDRPRHDRGPAVVRVHVAFSNDAVPQMLSDVARARIERSQGSGFTTPLQL